MGTRYSPAQIAEMEKAAETAYKNQLLQINNAVAAQKQQLGFEDPLFRTIDDMDAYKPQWEAMQQFWEPSTETTAAPKAAVPPGRTAPASRPPAVPSKNVEAPKSSRRVIRYDKSGKRVE
jgi:hypothetical protein